MSDSRLLTDIVDGILAGPEIDAWLAANPALAEEVALARRVRALLTELALAEIAVPADFEAQLFERLRADAALLDLVDLGLSGWGMALLELLSALFALLPAPRAATASV